MVDRLVLEHRAQECERTGEGAKFIDWTQPIQVLSSAAGFYIGMLDADGSPMCRFSAEYWQTVEEAQSALDNKSFSLKLWL